VHSTDVLIALYVKINEDQNHDDDDNDDNDDDNLRCTQLLQNAEIVIIIMNWQVHRIFIFIYQYKKLGNILEKFTS
jgi:hypothetical protein